MEFPESAEFILKHPLVLDPNQLVSVASSGVASEVVKSLSLTLGLPTVSSTYGKAGDIREWHDLTASQKNYLIQVLYFYYIVLY